MTQTTEGTGPGAVERYIPRLNNNLIRVENIVGIEQVVNDNPPTRIDGGVIGALSMLSAEDQEVILKAAQILKNLYPYQS